MRCCQPAPGSSEYRAGCPTETMACLSVVGWLFTITFTYLGFFFLAFATMWNAHIVTHLKHIAEKWRELRGDNQTAAEQQPQDGEQQSQAEQPKDTNV